LGWFLTCFGIGWFASFLGILGTAQQWNWPVIYLVYVAECAASLGWALAIFKVVMGEAVSWPEILIDLKRYFFKGLISASISGLVLGLAVYNLRFYFSLRVSTHILIFILMGFVATVFIYFLMMTFYQWPGVSAFLMGTITIQIHCPSWDMDHVLMAHLLPAAVGTMVASLLGAFWFARWKK